MKEVEQVHLILLSVILECNQENGMQNVKIITGNNYNGVGVINSENNP